MYQQAVNRLLPSTHGLYQDDYYQYCRLLITCDISLMYMRSIQRCVLSLRLCICFESCPVYVWVMTTLIMKNCGMTFDTLTSIKLIYVHTLSSCAILTMYICEFMFQIANVYYYLLTYKHCQQMAEYRCLVNLYYSTILLFFQYLFLLQSLTSAIVFLYSD